MEAVVKTPGPLVVAGNGHLADRITDLLKRMGEPVKRISGGPIPAAARGLIAVAEDDLENISTALKFREWNPRAVSVVRVFDTALGRRLEESGVVNRALSTSAIAAPAFAAASVAGPAGATFHDGGTAWTVERAGEAWKVEPAGTIPKTGSSGRTASVGRLATAFLSLPGRVPGPAWLVLLATLAVIGVSAALFRRWLGLTPIDALYFVTTTITTVGYGDISLLNVGSWAKIYGILLMLGGAALLASLYALITDLIVSSRLASLTGSGRPGWTGHAIVSGTDHAARRVAEEFRRLGSRVVLVGENRPESVPGGVAFVAGDASHEAILRRAGAADAAALVAADGNDTHNLAVGLLAKKLNPGIRAVLRIYDDDLAGRIRSSLGIDVALSTSFVAAPVFAAAALVPGAVHGMEGEGFFVAVVPESGSPGSFMVTARSLAGRGPSGRAPAGSPRSGTRGFPGRSRRP